MKLLKIIACLFVFLVTPLAQASDIEQQFKHIRHAEEMVAESLTFGFNNLDKAMEKSRPHFSESGWQAFQSETAALQKYIKRTQTVVTTTADAYLIEPDRQIFNAALNLQHGSQAELSLIMIEIRTSGSKEKNSFQITDLKITPRQSVDFLNLK